MDLKLLDPNAEQNLTSTTDENVVLLILCQTSMLDFDYSDPYQIIAPLCTAAIFILLLFLHCLWLKRVGKADVIHFIRAISAWLAAIFLVLSHGVYHLLSSILHLEEIAGLWYQLSWIAMIWLSLTSVGCTIVKRLSMMDETL